MFDLAGFRCYPFFAECNKVLSAYRTPYKYLISEVGVDSSYTKRPRHNGPKFKIKTLDSVIESQLALQEGVEPGSVIAYGLRS